MPKRGPTLRAAARAPEERSLNAGDPGGGLSAYLPSPVLSGVAVTPETALTFTAAFACINVIATDCASLPLTVKRKRRGGGREEVPNDPRYSLVYCEPNANATSMRFRQALIGHRLGWGNAYAEIVRYKSGSLDGYPAELHLLSPKPTDTYPDRDKKTGRLVYRVDGGRRTLAAEDVIHHAGLGWNGISGYSPIALARQAVGLGIAAEQFAAAFFGNGASPRGALKYPKKLTPDAKRNLRESWEAVHQGTANAHRVAIFEEGLEWVNISISPEDAQFLEQRQFQVIEICRMFRVPPHKVGDWSQTGSAYRAVEEANLDYRNTTLGPETEALEQELNRKLFTKRERAHGLHVAHDYVSLMRGDSRSRMAYWKDRFATGSASPDMIAEAEGENPLPGDLGNHFYIPSGFRRLDAPEPAPAAPAPGQPAPAEPDADDAGETPEDDTADAADAGGEDEDA